VEEAAHHLRLACEVLAPYDEVKYTVPQNGQGRDPNGPEFQAAMTAASNATDDAKAELDFTRVDNGYRNAIKAIHAL
jgi:hypothetical protein